MSKKLNLHVPFLLGIFLIGLFSANVSQGQINAYWDVNGTNAGQGGTGLMANTSVNWTTNSVNATGNSNGPTGGGTFAVGNGAATSNVTYTTNGATWTSNSGAYNFNFGGSNGTVNWSSAYQAYGMNLLTSGYIWNIDGTGANNRTITTTNGVNLGANTLILANGGRGSNSFTFAPGAGQAVYTSNITTTNFVIAGTGGGGLTLRNLQPDSATNSFGVFVQGATTKITNMTGPVTNYVLTNTTVAVISSNAPITVDIGLGSKISLGTQSSQGGQIDAAIINSSASGVALNLTNSSSGNITFNGVISGANGLVLDNASSGKIVLNGANTYAGGTTVNSTASGQINLGSSNALGSGTVTVSTGSTAYLRASANALDFTNAVNIGTGASLQLSSTNNNWKTTWSGVIDGAGGINYNFADAGLYLTGTNSSFGNGMNISSSGTLYVSKLGMAGANSSIGTNGTITISPASANAPTVRWTGSTNETSDKNFALTTVSSAGSAGVNIYADGAGTNTLTLNGNINSTGINNKAITLAGYSTNTLILNGTINETATYTNRVIIGTSGSGTVVLANTNNSFSGAVTITNDTASQFTVLSVANIGMSGTNSALGKNGTINFGSKTNSSITTLKYTGTGETSDKVLNMAGTGAGLTLDQSGAGLLKFSNAVTTTGTGAKTITLTGSTAGTGELLGGISDLGGVSSLTKSGSGTWTLSGINTYTGNTTISGGTLKIGLTNGLVNGVLNGSSATGNGSTLDMTAAGNYVMNSYGASSATYGQNMVFTNSSGGGGNYTLTFTNANNYVSGGSAAGRTLNNASTNLTVSFSGAVDIGSSGDNDVTFTGPGGFTINGSLTNSLVGVRALTKSGDGTLTLNAASGYNGATTLSLGTIALGVNGTLGTNSVIMSAGTLAVGTSSSTIKDLTVNNGTITGTGTLTSPNNFTFVNTNTTVVSAKLAGSGVLNKSGAGTTTLSGDNSYSGMTTVTGGTLTLSGSNSAASGGVTLTGGTLNINNNNALGSGNLALGGATIDNTSGFAVVNAGNNNWTWNSLTALTFGTTNNNAANNLDLGTGTVTLTGTRGINLLGTGTKLTMGNVINGVGTTITATGTENTLEMRGLSLSTSATAVTNSLAGTANLTISGVIANGTTNANGVNIKGTGTTTFSGANTYTGGTEVFSGATLVYGASDVTADTGAVAISGTMNIGTFSDTVASVKVNDNGSLTGSSGVLSAGSFSMYGPNTVSAILGGGSATLLKMTQNTVTLLSGANTYGGLTTVQGGTIKLGSSTALGSTHGTTTVGTGGFLDLNGQTGVAETLNYGGSGGLLNSAASTTAIVTGAVDIGSVMTVETTGNITLSGQLTGSVSKNLIKSGAGTLTFTATNSTFAGTNTVSAGTLLVDAGASVASSKSIVNGGLLKVNGTAGNVTVNTNGILGGSGIVGALTLQRGAFLNPGNSPGLLTASASSSWAAGSTYNWEINNATGLAETNWDVFYVSGASGALDLSDLTSSAQMNLVLKSLSPLNVASATLANYSTSTSYEWVIAKAAIFTGIADGRQDLTSLFNINSDAFNGGSLGSLPNGGFQVVASGLGSDNLRTLNLMAIPEPSTGSLLGFGLAGLVVTRLLRRKQI
jgi:autotransporter-associated beta strand protein